MGDRCAVGIDPSLAGFAVAIADDAGVALSERATKPSTTLGGRMDRYDTLVSFALDLVERARPSIVLVEGYAYGAKGNSVIHRAELGGILRWDLLAAGYDVVEVAPKQLKKFATGKGNASKLLVVTSLSRRYGREFSTDNEADAYALAMLGRVVLGREQATNAAQREAAASVQQSWESAA